MNIIKRDGSEAVFNRKKIENAIRKARTDVDRSDWMNRLEDNDIA